MNERLAYISESPLWLTFAAPTQQPLDLHRGCRGEHAEEPPPTWLAGSYLWAAVMADLHRRCGTTQTANRYRDVAFKLAPTPAVKELLQRRLMRSPVA